MVVIDINNAILFNIVTMNIKATDNFNYAAFVAKHNTGFDVFL
jgi:hypothetical protein